MKQRHQQGFGMLEGAVIVAVAVLMGAVIYLFISRTQSTSTGTEKSSDNSQAVVQQSSTTPKGWKVYKDDTYKFSIAYPGSFTPAGAEISLGDTTEATDKSAFQVEFQKHEENAQSPAYAPLRITISHETLGQAVNSRKANIAAIYPNMSLISTLIDEKPVVVDGKTATRIDWKQTAQYDKSISYYTEVYTNANDRTYTFQTTSYGEKAFDTDDAQNMLKSFKFN